MLIFRMLNLPERFAFDVSPQSAISIQHFQRESLTSPGIGERLRDDLVFVFVDDVTEALLVEHRDVVSVGLKHDPELLNTQTDEIDPAGLAQLFALLASSNSTN